MILGIGTDMASVERIETVLQKHGDRFTARCFADEERGLVESRANGDAAIRAAGYAKRWAAKEACAKALGLGIRDDIYLKDIVVTNDKDGKPSLELRGGARKRLDALSPVGGATIHVSLTDEKRMALAFVVISTGGNP